MCGRYCIVGPAMHFICILPLLWSGYIDLQPLAIDASHSLPNLTGCPFHYLSTADDRTKQITKHVEHVEHVEHAQNANDS